MARNTRRRSGEDDVDNDRRNEIRRELLDMDPADIPDYVASLDSTGELQVANEWLVNNGMTPVSADTFDQSDDVVDTDTPVAASAEEAEVLRNEREDPTSPPQSEGAPVGDINAALEANENHPAQQQLYDEALAEAADEYARRIRATEPGRAVSLEGIEAPEGSSVTESQEFLAAAREAGEEQYAEDRDRELAGSTDLDEDQRRRQIDVERRERETVGDTQTPRWLLEFAGGDLDEQQKQRYVDYWNDDHGTNFTSFEQIVPLLDSMGHTAYTENMTNAVLSAQEPLISESISIPFKNGAKQATYTQAEMEALRGMGFSNDAITRLVRLSAFAGGEESFEDGGRPDISAIAAIARYYGVQPGLERTNQVQQEVAGLEEQLGLGAGGYRNMTAEERRALRENLEAKRRTFWASPGKEPGDGTPWDDELAALAKIEGLFRAEEGAVERGGTPGVLAGRNNYNRGIDLYNGDQVLAFIHTVDPQLAARIASTGGDMSKLDGHDDAAALNILDRGGLINRGSTAFEQLGGRIGESVLQQLAYFDRAGGAGGAGGAGKVRRMVDPVSVAEQARSMFTQLGLGEPTEELVAALTNNLQKNLDGAAEGMSFDISARIMDWVKGQPIYSELYGKMTPGMDPQDYRGQFVSGVADLLGAEIDDTAVRAGMRGNDYQSALGSAIGNQDSMLTNSRLRGRFAAAKQSIDEFT